MSSLLLGVGNRYRSDDGVGHWVAERLTERDLPLEIRRVSGEGATLLDAWQGFERVFLVDAVQAQGEPGKIYRFAAHERPLPSRFFNYSTHNFSVAEAVEMGRVLERLPPEMFVWGIEGVSFAAGVGLSKIVAEAAEVVVGEVVQLLVNGEI